VQKNIDLDKLALQQEEVSEVRFIDYRDLRRKVMSHEPGYVPHDEEYKKLFAYLDQC